MVKQADRHGTITGAVKTRAAKPRRLLPRCALQPSEIAALEIALVLAGPDGQVHLVLADGRVRYFRTLYSEPRAGQAS